MEVIRTASGLSQLESWRGDRPLILVPTMGALHAGHLSLVSAGVEQGPVVVSIFVNPTQFGPQEDLASYPRQEAEDIAQLEALGVQAVYAPTVEQMYGDEVSATIQPGSRGMGLCSGDRPGHFAGVLTIVAKLFGMIQPEIAIFGRKDAQQCLVIEQMVAREKLGVKLIDLPTIRDANGLALSSRNQYLEGQQRQQALCLFGALYAARDALIAGERDVLVLQELMTSVLSVADQIEYVEIRQVPNLETMQNIADEKVLFAVAAQIGAARLIDNMVLDFSTGDGVDSFLLGAFA